MLYYQTRNLKHAKGSNEKQNKTKQNKQTNKQTKNREPARTNGLL